MSESTGSTNLEPVLISPVVGGMIRTWSEDETRLWSVDDPEALGALLGRGTVSRTALPDNKFREVAFFDALTQTLTVQPRFASPDSTALAAPFKLTDASAPTTDAWEDLESTLASIAISAAGRGEFWLAELGGWDSPHEPNCLFTTVDESGLANAVMEATPAPAGTGVWPEVPNGQTGVSVSAPASQDTIEAAGIFAVSAIETWGVTPWDINLTFGKLVDFA
ncbi:hypothetical protein ACFWAD_19020 [Rhodococcus sp. NPDC059969]|uniref:hypothetical protein n=1 Tax=Rhodococcus sp. NPDC059969 TaxID=3347018 RepID=UPI00366B9276